MGTFYIGWGLNILSVPIWNKLYSQTKHPERMSAEGKASEMAEDKMLVDRFKNGDVAAYEEMVNRYWGRIFAMVFQLLKNRQDAEEVTQDAFVRAHRGLENFRGDSSFSTWLFQIATNLARNKYWYWWRRKRGFTLSLEETFANEGEGTLLDVFPAEGETPTDAAVTQEFVDRVAECMETLNPRHREILELRNVRNLSYEEISDLLGISIGTVKSRIARARDSLKSSMGVDFNEG